METKRTIGKRVLAVLVAFLLLSGLAIPTGEPESLAAKKVKLSATYLDMKIGDSLKLSLKNVSKKQEKSVKWKTSDAKIATVSAKKKSPAQATVTAVSGGVATITAKIKKKSYQCTVDVMSPEEDCSDFVLLTDVVPDVILEMRYYSTYNFVGDRIAGYEEPVALLTSEAAEALKKVSDKLVQKG